MAGLGSKIAISRKIFVSRGDYPEILTISLTEGDGVNADIYYLEGFNNLSPIRRFGIRGEASEENRGRAFRALPYLVSTPTDEEFLGRSRYLLRLSLAVGYLLEGYGPIVPDSSDPYGFLATIPAEAVREADADLFD